MIGVYLTHWRQAVLLNSLLVFKPRTYLQAVHAVCTKDVKQVGHRKQKLKPLLIKGSSSAGGQVQEGLSRNCRVVWHIKKKSLSSDWCHTNKAKGKTLKTMCIVPPFYHKWKIDDRPLGWKHINHQKNTAIHNFVLLEKWSCRSSLVFLTLPITNSTLF